MKCPHCADVVLVMSDRQGIEIDYCPQCRGVWLDRGELDKIIERGANNRPGAGDGGATRPQPDFADSDYHENRRHRGYRKKSWLNEIFD